MKRSHSRIFPLGEVDDLGVLLVTQLLEYHHGDGVVVLDEAGEDVHSQGLEPPLGFADEPGAYPPLPKRRAPGQTVDPALAAVVGREYRPDDAAPLPFL